MSLDFGRLARVSKRIAGDPRWRRYYLQRYVRRPAVREFIARNIARLKPRPPLLSGAQQSRVATFREKGILLLPSFATGAEVDELRAYLDTMPCYDPDDVGAAGAPWPAAATKSCVHAYYRIDDLMKAPHVLAFANNPHLLALASGILGCRPTLCEMNCWWLHHGFDLEVAKIKHDGFVMHHNREYHRDIDDWSMVRFFLYLTDVDAGGGPHSYLPGTHKLHLGMERGIRFEIDADPLLQSRWDVTGPRGTALLMDPYGLHRGTVPTTSDRLILSFTYSLGTTNTWAPRTPLRPRPAEFAAYENRLFLRD